MLRRDLNATQPLTWMIWTAMLASGVVGRLFQPDWNVTPTVALTLLATMLFAQRWVTALLPIGILAISNLWLPGYDNLTEMITVFSCLLLPVVMHQWLRSGSDQFSKFLPRLAVGTLTPSLFFFVATNFVVWLTKRGTAFEDSFAGLLNCYGVAVPFYRWMLQGDVLYVAVLFGSYAAICLWATRGTLATQRVK